MKRFKKMPASLRNNLILTQGLDRAGFDPIRGGDKSFVEVSSCAQTKIRL